MYLQDDFGPRDTSVHSNPNSVRKWITRLGGPRLLPVVPLRDYEVPLWRTHTDELEVVTNTAAVPELNDGSSSRLAIEWNNLVASNREQVVLNPSCSRFPWIRL